MKPAAKAVKQEIVKAPDVPITSITSLNAPDYLAEFGTATPEGFEEVRPTDVKVPRLALAQALTPQLNEDEPNHIVGLKKGDWFNTITGKNYGQTVIIIPLMKFGTRFYFRNMDEGGGILCRSNDMKHGEGEPGGECAKCELSKFGSARGGDGKGTACAEFYNFPNLIVEDGKIDVDNLAIWAAKSSHIDAAKHLIGLAMRRKLTNGSRAPMWSGMYSLTSKNKKFTEKLSAYVPVIDNAGWVAQVNVKMARDAYEFMHQLRESGRLTTDVEEETFEAGASEANNT